jgi:hypothetical protein
LTNDFHLNVGSYLVSPNGVALGFGQNSVNGTNTQSLTAFTLDPVPGLWTLIVDFATPVVGDEVSQSFTGTVEFNRVTVSATGLPNNKFTKLAAGTPITVPVKITNNGALAGDFFIDARLNNAVSVTLAPFSQVSGLGLPLVVGPPQWLCRRIHRASRLPRTRPCRSNSTMVRTRAIRIFIPTPAPRRPAHTRQRADSCSRVSGSPHRARLGRTRLERQPEP